MVGKERGEGKRADQRFLGKVLYRAPSEMEKEDLAGELG